MLYSKYNHTGLLCVLPPSSSCPNLSRLPPTLHHALSPLTSAPTQTRFMKVIKHNEIEYYDLILVAMQC